MSASKNDGQGAGTQEKNGWSLIYEGFDPEEEGLREALCTLGNGYFATRGAATECEADSVHYPGTYLAGGYNRLSTEIAGRTVENEDLVNLPNWLELNFRVAGENWFNLQAVELLDYRQELDLKKGLLLRTLRFRDKQGRQTFLTSRRLVHMGQPHLAAVEIGLTAENWSGPVQVRSVLDGRVVNGGVDRYRNLNNKHLVPLKCAPVDGETMLLKMQTSQSEITVAQAARTRVAGAGAAEIAEEDPEVVSPGCVAREYVFELEEGSQVRVEKIVALYTSRDHTISECGLEACRAVADCGGFDELLATHALAWEQLWRRFDIDIELTTPRRGAPAAMVLRLYIFHLLQTVSMSSMDLDIGVPARGWHGEAYRGHVFWDELFVFPLLNLRVPEITRSLLRYRHRRLNAAREAARLAGFKGAMYPWQSGSMGREESQSLHLNPRSGRWMPDHSHLQRHVGLAIAYNVWQYYQVTRDMEFLAFYGAEMILEVARFWASIAVYSEEHGRYEILGVMGPDEYHDGYPDVDEPGLNNNAYTNIMAVWVLCRALELLEILPLDRRTELRETLGLKQEETDHWQQVSRKMRLVFHGDGIISQFEGYDRLAELDWEGYRDKYGDIHRLDRILEAEGDSTNRYKVSKQADVLMLFYLFSSEELGRLFERLDYPFEYETIPKSIDYYMARTSHGSTLSRIVHAWVLARSDRARSWQLFAEALESDVADIQGGTTPEGVHLGAMAGTVDLIQRGYLGLETRGDVLWLNPCPPEEFVRLRLLIRYRGQSLELEATPGKLRVRTINGAPKPIRVGFGEEIRELKKGEVMELDL